MRSLEAKNNQNAVVLHAKLLQGPSLVSQALLRAELWQKGCLHPQPCVLHPLCAKPWHRGRLHPWPCISNPALCRAVMERLPAPSTLYAESLSVLSHGAEAACTPGPTSQTQPYLGCHISHGAGIETQTLSKHSQA